MTSLTNQVCDIELEVTTDNDVIITQDSEMIVTTPEVMNELCEIWKGMKGD